jgi:tetratricopeptide (TPR) repeat protein
MCTLNAELIECQRLAELGNYIQASKLFKACLLKSNNLRTSVELCDALESQGLWKEAHATLDQALRMSDGHDEEEMLVVRANMALCLLEPIVSCNFEESTERAALLYRKFLQLPASIDTQRDAVRFLPSVPQSAL